MKRIAFVLFLFVITGMAVQGVYGGEAASQRVLSVTDDPYTSVTVTWKGDGAPQTVRFMKKTGGNREGFSGYREAAGESVKIWQGYYRYEASMKYLIPGGEYVYQIYDSNGKVLSDMKEFDVPSGDEKQTKFIMTIHK